MNLIGGILKIIFSECQRLYWIPHTIYKLRFKILASLGICFLPFWLFFPLYLQRQADIIESSKHKEPIDKNYKPVNLTNLNIPSITALRMQWIRKKLQKMSKRMDKLFVNKIVNLKELPTPNYNVHVFYYAWFRNRDFDGFWNHWQAIGKSGDLKKEEPPDVISSSFYPSMGCYSSRNMTVIEEHMKMIKKAGIGVLILSWVPPPLQDSPKGILKNIMDLADKYKIKVTLQIESFENRSTSNVLKDIRFFISKFGNHPAMYRMEKDSKNLPVFYIHNTFQIAHVSWKRFLSYEGNSSIRGSKYDGIFLAHLSEYHHGPLLKAANFDGFYTYSSANGKSYGSTWKNWVSLAKFASEKDLIFIPCVGPGYSLEKETKDIKHRVHGNYYEVAWRSALTVQPKVIAITSFNNWEEGNQIEPAKAKRNQKKTYYDYDPEGSNFYLDLTLWWNKRFISKSFGCSTGHTP